jgi:Zn-dependent peptidase ImmA (M78 family)
MRQYLQEAALRFIIERGITALPVEPLRIASELGCKVFTYREYASIVKKPVESLIARYDNDGFTFWSRRDNRFIICYNSSLPFYVCRWTLLHEIGHIYLRHVAPETPLLMRVRSENRSLLEIEAQGFARRVLCPSIVLHNCKAFEPEEIIHLCGISREAAGYRSEYIKKLEARGKFGLHPLENVVERQFAPFVSRYLIQKAENDFLNRVEMKICA